MSSTVNTRLAVARDYAAMCALLDAVDELHRAGASWLFREPEAPPRPLEYFDDFFRGETCAALVAEADRVVGVALVLVRPTPSLPIFRQQSYGILDGIAVDAAFRRRGIGTALAKASAEWAESRGAAFIELGVYEFNDGARAFYEHLGFHTVSRKLRLALRGGD